MSKRKLTKRIGTLILTVLLTGSGMQVSCTSNTTRSATGITASRSGTAARPRGFYPSWRRPSAAEAAVGAAVGTAIAVDTIDYVDTVDTIDAIDTIDTIDAIDFY